MNDRTRTTPDTFGDLVKMYAWNSVGWFVIGNLSRQNLRLVKELVSHLPFEDLDFNSEKYSTGHRYSKRLGRFPLASSPKNFVPRPTNEMDDPNASLLKYTRYNVLCGPIY